MVRMRKSSLKDMSSDFVSGDFDADDYQNLESGSEDHEIDDHHISNQPVDVSNVIFYVVCSCLNYFYNLFVLILSGFKFF